MAKCVLKKHLKKLSNYNILLYDNLIYIIFKIISHNRYYLQEKNKYNQLINDFIDNKLSKLAILPDEYND